MDNLREVVDDLWGEIDEVFPIPSRVLPDPDTLDYYLFARQRKFFLTTNLEYGAYDLSRDIIYLNTQDVGKAPDERQPIIIYIMSDGGSLDEMWMLTDIMLASETPIITVNLGQAASAAALVFLSAPKRLMLPSAKVMLHQGSAFFHGDANKILDTTEDYRRDIKRMQDFVLARTNIPREVMDQHLKDDWYIDAEQCLEYGICTNIVSTMRELI